MNLRAYETGTDEIRLTLHSGELVNLRALRPDQIEIDDIAHALSQQCRFVGHSPQYYSVAQHSVIVSTMVPAAFALAALLHDASEAYLGDVSHFLKHSPELACYRAFEDEIQGTINERYGLPREIPEVVKLADRTLTDLEWRQFMLREPVTFAEALVPQSSSWSRSSFLRRFRQLEAGA
jgi:hypothetical protein